jgi:DNA-binding transcriptional ArsR family regulator
MTALVDIVTSRVKAEIFRLLFGLNRPELHLRELARQAGLSLGTIQQELRHLTRAGLVMARRDGNRVNYRANPAHPIYNELCAIVTKSDGLAAFLSKSLEHPQIELAFVFGSVAHGIAGAESDVDLIVVGSIGLRKLTGLLAGTSAKVGREINPHIFTAEEFRERLRKKDHFLMTVLREPKIFVKGSADELTTMGK